MITAKELLGEAVWCEGRSSPGFDAVALTLRRAASAIDELDAKLTEAIEICQQTAASLLRGGELAVKAQDVMDRQSKRIAELEDRIARSNPNDRNGCLCAPSDLCPVHGQRVFVPKGCTGRPTP